MTEALETFERLRALPAAVRTDGGCASSERGGAPRSAGRDARDEAGLTGRQLEISVSRRAGRTQRSRSARAVVRTVDHHVSACCKLGVTSRKDRRGGRSRMGGSGVCRQRGRYMGARTPMCRRPARARSFAEQVGVRGSCWNGTRTWPAAARPRRAGRAPGGWSWSARAGSARPPWYRPSCPRCDGTARSGCSRAGATTWSPRARGSLPRLRAPAPDLRDALRGGTADAVLDALLAELDGRHLLVVEDVHWPTEATIDALAFLRAGWSVIGADLGPSRRRDRAGARCSGARSGVSVGAGCRGDAVARAVSSLAADTAWGCGCTPRRRNPSSSRAAGRAGQGSGVGAGRGARPHLDARRADAGVVGGARGRAHPVETRLLDVVHPEWARDAAPASGGILEVRDRGWRSARLSRLAVANGCRGPGWARSAVLAALLSGPLDEARICTRGDLRRREVIVAHGPAAARRPPRGRPRKRCRTTSSSSRTPTAASRGGAAVSGSSLGAVQRAAVRRRGPLLAGGSGAAAGPGRPGRARPGAGRLAWHLYLDRRWRGGTVVDEAVASGADS